MPFLQVSYLLSSEGFQRLRISTWRSLLHIATICVPEIWSKLQSILCRGTGNASYKFSMGLCGPDLRFWCCYMLQLLIHFGNASGTTLRQQNKPMCADKSIGWAFLFSWAISSASLWWFVCNLGTHVQLILWSRVWPNIHSLCFFPLADNSSQPMSQCQGESYLSWTVWYGVYHSLVVLTLIQYPPHKHSH